MTIGTYGRCRNGRFEREREAHPRLDCPTATFRTSNDRVEALPTQSSLIEEAGKSTAAIFILPLITVRLRVRALPAHQ
jgi:hypothetical protein